jgi:hypothetical protein
MSHYAQTSDQHAVQLQSAFVEECGYLAAITDACTALDFIPIPFSSQTVCCLQHLTLTLVKQPVSLSTPLQNEEVKLVLQVWNEAGLTGQSCLELLVAADFLGAVKACEFLCASMAIELVHNAGPSLTKQKRQRLQAKYAWAGSYLL